MECSIEDIEVLTPEEIIDSVNAASDLLLPSTSKTKYMKVYQAFIDWKMKKNTQSFSQNVFLTYFNELSARNKPNTLWSYYSMLRSTVNLLHKIDISQYTKLLMFIKRKNENYRPVKAEVFRAEQIQKFLTEADDYEWLAIKVATIIGLKGGLRSEELVRIRVDDIKDEGNVLLVHIQKRKTKDPAHFVIEKEYRKIVNQYRYLRPPRVETDRFFLTYRKGKCICQPIGVNQFYKMPSLIAKHLQLENPKRYTRTGHSFRRSGASLLANADADIARLKNDGQWKSTKVAEGYVKNSVNYIEKTAQLITTTINLSRPNNIDTNQIDVPSVHEPNSEALGAEGCVHNEYAKGTRFVTSSTHFAQNSTHEYVDIPHDKQNNLDDYILESEDITCNTENLLVLSGKTFNFKNCNVTINLNK